MDQIVSEYSSKGKGRNLVGTGVFLLLFYAVFGFLIYSRYSKILDSKVVEVVEDIEITMYFFDSFDIFLLIVFVAIIIIMSVAVAISVIWDGLSILNKSREK